MKGRNKGKGKQNLSTQEAVPEADTTSSLSGENIRNRNEEIHKAAAAYWSLGQACGVLAKRKEDNVLGLFEELEERDWDAYEKRHND